MRNDLLQLTSIAEQLEKAGQELLATCAGEIYPCDAMATAILARTLALMRGFRMLMQAKSYSCAAPLVRLQLDSVLRFHGVVTCHDPHGIALQVFQGVPLRTIKHSDGKKMTDKHLQELLETANPWLPKIYNLASGYIHLSEQHFIHLLMQSSRDEHGTRFFQVSDEDDYIPEEHKAALVATFATISKGVVKLVEQWIQHRSNFTNAALLKRQLRTL